MCEELHLEEHCVNAVPPATLDGKLNAGSDTVVESSPGEKDSCIEGINRAEEPDAKKCKVT